MWAQVSFVLSQFTCLSDGQTDGRAGTVGQTVAKTALHIMQRSINDLIGII